MEYTYLCYLRMEKKIKQSIHERPLYFGLQGEKRIYLLKKGEVYSV